MENPGKEVEFGLRSFQGRSKGIIFQYLIMYFISKSTDENWNVMKKKVPKTPLTTSFRALWVFWISEFLVLFFCCLCLCGFEWGQKGHFRCEIAFVWWACETFVLYGVQKITCDCVCFVVKTMTQALELSYLLQNKSYLLWENYLFCSKDSSYYFEKIAWKFCYFGKSGTFSTSWSFRVIMSSFCHQNDVFVSSKNVIMFCV